MSNYVSRYRWSDNDKENDPKYVWKTVSLPAFTIHNGVS